MDSSRSHDQILVHISSADVKKVFRETSIRNGRVEIPRIFHSLPDFRPASEAALADALVGKAPNMGVLSWFDPLLGPYSSVEVKTIPWAQSLDFLRDIKLASLGTRKLLDAWIEEWLTQATVSPGPFTSLLPATQNGSTKTDRLIWRSRRVLNCLAHVLPVLSRLDPKVRSTFWNVIIADIAKIGAPTDSLWSGLKDGFDPLSLRAIWMRSIALLGVEAAFPSLLRADLIDKSLAQIEVSIQTDGLMQGGSSIATLSAGADLCMLGRIASVEPILHRVRLALASLRHRDGALVTFGMGTGNHAKLLNAVIGPGDWKASALFLESGIARVCTPTTNVWIKSPQSEQAWGAICEIEVASGAMLTNFAGGRSAVKFNAPTRAVKSHSKRRDEEECLILESGASFQSSGKNYTSLRQIRVERHGLRIEGEDVVRSDTDSQDLIVKEVCFAISRNCVCYLSKDRHSVLIVAARQQAWRFRAQGMDISVEMRSVTTQSSASQRIESFIVCQPANVTRTKYFRATWQFVIEEQE